MKRGKPLKRKKPLRAKRPLRNPPRRFHVSPFAVGWTQRVFALYGRRCSCGQRAVQGHHVIPRQVIMNAHHLTQDEREALEYDARNGLPICMRCHERHETATERVRRGVLRREHIAWAREHGFDHVLDRIYGAGLR